MINTRLFDGQEKNLQLYNGQALIDRVFRFFTVDDCSTCDDYSETNFDFPGYVSSYFRVLNEREGRQLLELSLSQSDEYLIANATSEQMTFEDLGNYYYEIGYVMTGGYEQVLRFGTLTVI